VNGRFFFNELFNSWIKSFVLCPSRSSNNALVTCSAYHPVFFFDILVSLFFLISLYPFAGGGAMVNHIIHIIPLVAEKGRIFGLLFLAA
jgi:hypothetical protein